MRRSLPHRLPHRLPSLLLVVIALGVLATAGMAQTGTAQEGYLLDGKLHAEPDSFSDEVAPLSRDERVRVVPIEDEAGWYAVYRSGEGQPAGYAFRPFVSRLGSSELAALQSDGVPLASQATVSDDDGKLPGIVFAETEARGVLVRVEQWANVRTGPGISYDAFGVIRPDVPFRVLEIERGWGKVELEGAHRYGYVSGSLLHRVMEPVVETPMPAPAEPEPHTSLTISGASAGGSATLGEAAEAEAAPGLEETTGIVYVTRTGHKYHRADCKHLRSVKFAMPLAEAMLDFAPCRTCAPPTSLPTDEPTP